MYTLKENCKFVLKKVKPNFIPYYLPRKNDFLRKFFLPWPDKFLGKPRNKSFYKISI